MRRVIVVLQWVIRLCAIVQLSLGALFWTGTATALIPQNLPRPEPP
jgi:hypothetical protein